jgi:hypothetical protein
LGLTWDQTNFLRPKAWPQKKKTSITHTRTFFCR